MKPLFFFSSSEVIKWALEQLEPKPVAILLDDFAMTNTKEELEAIKHLNFAAGNHRKDKAGVKGISKLLTRRAPWTTRKTR